MWGVDKQEGRGKGGMIEVEEVLSSSFGASLWVTLSQTHAEGERRDDYHY